MNKRHHKIIALLLGAGLLGVTGLASAAIVNSKHDLGTASTAANRVTTGTDETCVFCHTPHAAASNTVPLWNKALTTAPTGVNVYSSTTMDGTANFTGSTSMACLSCHDGTQAMDNIVNAPGSGGLTTGGGATGLAYVWTATVNADGTLKAGVTNLSANLGDDHPVAIPYAGGGLDTTPLQTEFTDPDFKVPTYNAINGGRWWFDADADTKMDSNEIRLYTVGAVANVECASCHDPHSNTNATFLRVANTSSAVCTACHAK